MSMSQALMRQRFGRLELLAVAMLLGGCAVVYMTGSALMPLVLIGFAGAVIFVSTRPAVGLATMLITVLVQYYIVSEPLCVNIRSINIYPDDMVGLLFVGGFCWRALTGRARHLHTVAFGILLVFMGFQGISLLRGSVLFGQTAFVQARNHFGLSSAALYFLSFSYDRKTTRRILWLFAAYAGYHVVVGLLRWAGVVSLSAYARLYPGTFVGERVLDRGAAQFIFIVSVGLAVAAINRLGERYRLGLSLLAVSGAIVLSALLIRSVWIAGLVTALWMLVKYGLLRVLRGMGLGLLVALVLVGSLALLTPGTVEMLGGQAADMFDQAVGSHRTWAWRVHGWETQLGRMSGLDFLIGKPFGVSLERDVIGEPGGSPHNFYMECLLYLGVPGVAAFVAVVVVLLVRLRRTRAHTGDLETANLCDMSELILVFHAVFFAAWGATMLSGVILGVMLVVAYRSQDENDDEPDPADASVRAVAGGTA